MPVYFNPQWREQYAETQYPFEDSSSLVTTDGMRLESDLFWDASLYVANAGRGVHLSMIVVSPGEVTIYIGTETQQMMCHAKFPTLDPPDVLDVVDTHGRAAGILVSDPMKLSVFQAWRLGTYTFAPDAAAFVASVCIPLTMPGVTAVHTKDGEAFVGEVILYAEKGVVLRHDSTSPEASPRIRVDVVGEPLAKRAACEDPDVPDLFANRNYLRTINHIPADAHGNFMITTAGHISPDNILRIYPTESGLHFEAVGQPVGDL